MDTGTTPHAPGGGNGATGDAPAIPSSYGAGGGDVGDVEETQLGDATAAQNAELGNDEKP